MRRTVPALLIFLAACGGGDDDATDTASGTDAPPTTTATSSPMSVDGCESEPDPADYVAGETPQAVRPCEIPTVLAVHTLREGNGRIATGGDTVIVDYIGIRSEDGAIFDDSYSRGVPIEFPLGRGGVIQGWDDGLLGTQAGSLIKLDIPAELAYGDDPPGGEESDIEPGDALSFMVEVRSVIAPVTIEDAPLDIELEPSIGATEVTVTEITPGEGPGAEVGDTIVGHLMLVRGDNQVVLFNTWEQSDPFQIILADGETLPGVREGLEGAQVGSLVAISMPPAEAFGEQGESSLGLPAGVDLIAVIEVVGIY